MSFSFLCLASVIERVLGGFGGGLGRRLLGLLPGLRNAAGREGDGLINRASGSPSLRWDPLWWLVRCLLLIALSVRARAAKRQ